MVERTRLFLNFMMSSQTACMHIHQKQMRGLFMRAKANKKSQTKQ